MMEQREAERLSLSNLNTQQANFIDLRLNTKELIKDVEVFLSGKKVFYKQNSDGSYSEYEEQAGTPLANKEGITALINMLLMRSHHHCIQGNFDSEHYWNNLCKTRKEISLHIIENCYEWGIDDNKLNYIIDTLMDFLEKVISRLINNKERESYMNQFQTREIINDNNKRGLLSGFAGGFSRGS